MTTRTSFPEAIGCLSHDHIEMRMALNMLEREVNAVAEYHEPDSDALGGGVQYFAKYPARCHHPIEEMIHAALKARAPEIADAIPSVGQHEKIVERIGEFAMMMRNLFLDAPKWRVPFCATARSFITLKRDHIREEEKVLFPAAQEHLTAEDWLEIDRAARESLAQWNADPGHVAATDVLSLGAEREARASGSARRR